MRVPLLPRTFANMMLFDSLAPEARHFYAHVADILAAGGVDFLVGGAFALDLHTGIRRDTKDFDLMLRPADVERALARLRAAGYQAEYAFSHWIAKAYRGDYFVDLIYRAGNGLCTVDDEWFSAAREALVFGKLRGIAPIEEMIWQKAYIMERERFDGADVLHLLRAGAGNLDWARLQRRFGPDWRVLLSHLVLFEFVYPHDASAIPRHVLSALLMRAMNESAPHVHADPKICRGTLLSREQYLPDLAQWNYQDVRLDGRSAMTADERSRWTQAAPGVAAEKLPT
jgi:hypothetical protein